MGRDQSDKPGPLAFGALKMFETRQRRYERYRAWCSILGVAPAALKVWEKELRKISELNYVRD